MNRASFLTAVMILTFASMAAFAVENKDLPEAALPVEIAKPKAPALPVMATVAGFPALYVANNEEWTSVVVKDDKGYRTLNAKAANMPILMHLRPNDRLNVVVQENDGQDWVLGVNLISDDGSRAEIDESDADVIVKMDKTSDPRVAYLETRRGGQYHIDKKLARYSTHDGQYVRDVSWLDLLRTGVIVSFRYIERQGPNGVIRWAVAAKRNGGKFVSNPHGVPPIVTNIWKTRIGPDGRRANDWWYYVQTDHPKIRFEVDARKYSDVRLQKIGEEPLWHRNPETSPYAEAAILSGPSISGPSTVVSVAVGGDTISNNLNGSISSNNTISSVNSNSNENSNVSSNTNNNANSNVNANTNNNQNNNANNNQNQNSNNNANNNQNSNNNSNANSNQNDVNNQNQNNNSLTGSVQNTIGQ